MSQKILQRRQIPMIFLSKLTISTIVTIYNYIVYGLYKVTILSLLRVSIYIKLLYGAWLVVVSWLYYLPSLISTFNKFSKTFIEFARQSGKTIESQHYLCLQPRIYSFEINLNFVNRDINPSSN